MYQQITIVGNLGKDPEMKYTTSGKAVTSFSVAVSNKHKQDGEWVDETTWFRVTAWEKQAESVNNYLKKGSKVMVVGRVSLSSWIDKESGDARGQLEVTAHNVVFLSSRQDSEGGGEWSGKPQARPVDEDEQLPF